MANARRWVLVAGSVVALLVGCAAKVAPEAEGDAGAADGGDDAEVVCELVDGTCVGRGCCQVAGGLVDFERGCYGRLKAIYCPPPLHPSNPFFTESGGFCMASAAVSCVVRDLEDGGTEVYYRNYTNEDLPGFSPCPSELYAEVMAMQYCR
jgi:hypothetical protein